MATTLYTRPHRLIAKREARGAKPDVEKQKQKEAVSPTLYSLNEILRINEFRTSGRKGYDAKCSVAGLRDSIYSDGDS